MFRPSIEPTAGENLKLVMTPERTDRRDGTSRL